MAGSIKNAVVNAKPVGGNIIINTNYIKIPNNILSMAKEVLGYRFPETGVANFHWHHIPFATGH